jgi:hypothetical protein
VSQYVKATSSVISGLSGKDETAGTISVMIPTRSERLVDWNVSVFTNLLQQNITSRLHMTRDDTNNENHWLDHELGTTPFNEISSILKVTGLRSNLMKQ